MLNLRVLRFLIVVGAMTVTGACLAQQSSSVWDTFERTLGRNAGLGAHEIAVTYEVPGDSGPQVGSYTTHVGRWDAKGNPDRVLVKGGEKTYAMARLDLSIAEHIVNHLKHYLNSRIRYTAQAMRRLMARYLRCMKSNPDSFKVLNQ